MSDHAHRRAAGALPNTAQIELPIHILPDIGYVLSVGRKTLEALLAKGEVVGDLVPGQAKLMVENAHRFELVLLNAATRAAQAMVAADAEELRRADPTLTPTQAVERAFNNAVRDGMTALSEEISAKDRRRSGPEIVLPPHTGLKS